MIVKKGLAFLGSTVLFLLTSVTVVLACSAGGPGSSACSVSQGSSCSVTCTAGYYACCDAFPTFGCVCVPKDAPPPVGGGDS